jgi:hypothetical protein
MRMLLPTLQRLLHAPLAAWRRIGSFNEWLAINFTISPSRVLQIELGALAAFGFTMMQIGEWLVAVTCWTLFGFILLAKSLAWRGMAGRPILTTILRCTLAIGSLAVCVLLITITDLRKPTSEPWSNLQKLWQHSPVAAPAKAVNCSWGVRRRLSRRLGIRLCSKQS